MPAGLWITLMVSLLLSFLKESPDTDLSSSRFAQAFQLSIPVLHVQVYQRGGRSPASRSRTEFF